MANSTAGQLFGAGLIGYVGWPRMAASPISGAGSSRLFDTWDFAAVVNGNWQRIAGTQFVGPPGAKSTDGMLTKTGPWYGTYIGTYKVSGQTRLNNVPFRAHVFLYAERHPSLIIASTFTDASGNFVFDRITPGKYLVLGTDGNDQLNAKVWALVDAVPM